MKDFEWISKKYNLKSPFYSRDSIPFYASLTFASGFKQDVSISTLVDYIYSFNKPNIVEFYGKDLILIYGFDRDLYDISEYAEEYSLGEEQYNITLERISMHK